MLLNNLKNDIGQFSYYEHNENHIINKNNTIKLILILLLIINFYLWNNFGILLLNYNEKDIDNNIDLNDYHNIMGNYTLCSLYEQITILVDNIINWKIDNKSLLNFFDNMKEQTLKDIQIIFILPNDSKYNHIRSSIKKQKIFKIFSPTSNLE